MSRTALSLLVWVSFIHLAGLYLFTRGFLLTRLSLSHTSTCTPSDQPCTLPPTRTRVVFLIIDSLRFDFISPSPPSPPSPFHHNVLMLPSELTERYPRNSVIYNAYPDPPTTTLQRIKGLVTGSLPTFVDMGSNFGGSSIEEDSVIKQLHLAGKKIAFMGDDTWLTVFPSTFEPALTFPYDSFNVEDLHTVDNGVIKHLFPLLGSNSSVTAEPEWDFLIGHFLGVDHVGHRVGPDHPSMRMKLEQMNTVLTGVVDSLDDDTLLVVLGDHGMDSKGDHGGDGELETNAGLWVYSKTPFVAPAPRAGSALDALAINATFPGAPSSHRRVQQIDLVPTLSLLLGLPIPFNNLGTLIPELIPPAELAKALGINARQVKRYLDAYRTSPAGGELDAVWPSLEALWAAAVGQTGALAELAAYTRLALAECRALWAQFDGTLMGLGLVVLFAGLLSTGALFVGVGAGEVKGDWTIYAESVLARALRGVAGGSVIGCLTFLAVGSEKVEMFKGVDSLSWVLFGAPLGGALVILSDASHLKALLRTPLLEHIRSLPLPLLLHALSFLSNSFTFWEDRVVPFLLLTSLVPAVLAGVSAPTSRFRKRILGLVALFAVAVRLMAVSTVCREEQQPFCHVTFFTSSSLPSPPLPIRILTLPTAIALPWVLRRWLALSRSNGGSAAVVLPWILRPALLAGSFYWLLEWVDSIEAFGAEWSPTLRTARTLAAWAGLSGVAFGGLGIWWLVPSCLTVTLEESGPTASGPTSRKVTILGYANAFGGPYLVFWAVFFGIVSIATQLTGQVTLALAAVAVLAHLELIDTLRDVDALNTAFASATPSQVLDLDPASPSSASAFTPSSVKFVHVVPLALLAVHAFHATGHQSTISSIQWKSAFMLTSTLTYPFSPALVVLNSFGPVFLLALAAPLVALWNVAPRPQPAASAVVTGASVRAGLAIMFYFAALLFGAAVSAAVLRRHLMVWKVFAPRFMSAAVGLIAVDLAVLIGVGIGVRRVSGRMSNMFHAMDTKTT